MSTYSQDKSAETLEDAPLTCPKAPRLRARRAPLSESNIVTILPQSKLNFAKSEKKRFYSNLVDSS